MKVLLVNASQDYGGAARAASRLHRALLQAGVESRLLVLGKTGDDATIVAHDTLFRRIVNKARPYLDRLPLRLHPSRQNTHFSTGIVPFSGLVDQINGQGADIVHLHWTCNGMLHIDDVKRIEAPVVWSMHDNWVFTGGCHVKWDCERYRQGCGRCPQLRSGRDFDLSRYCFERKRRVLADRPRLTMVGLSRWMAEQARLSPVLAGTAVVQLPNPIDIDAYFPVDKAQARRMLGLPVDGRFVLFGAIAAGSDVNKGLPELLAALEKVRTPGVQLMVFGSSGSGAAPPTKQPVHYLGHLHDDISLRLLYSAADVTVVPSRQENLSNVIMESLACGTPVAAFATGGNGDLVEHGCNGYLARPFEDADLACGIDTLLNAEDPATLARAARESVVTRFEQRSVAHRYIDLYRSLLTGGKGAHEG